jgi:hypothetical protein
MTIRFLESSLFAIAVASVENTLPPLYHLFVLKVYPLNILSSLDEG